MSMWPGIWVVVLRYFYLYYTSGDAMVIEYYISCVEVVALSSGSILYMSMDMGIRGMADRCRWDMLALDQLFTTIEYDGITVEYLTFSKIGKVMHHIVVLTDDKILNVNKTATTALSAAPALLVAPAAMNGNDHERTKSEEMEEEKEEIKAEDKAEKDVMEATAAIDLNASYAHRLLS
ncbi:hypothetical protein BDQ17DRAFT_1337542 [Cyathus striatus]|nr:hypothetical protein BDQ17DRAFT_1337542 [Cyathus striatus]